MTIQQLKCVIEVAETNSIPKAAENLCVDQLFLRKVLRELEENIGISVFSCTSRGAFPTQKGEEFLDRARSILQSVRDVEAFYDVAAREAFRLKLAVPICCYAAEALASLVQELPAETPLKVDYHEMNSIVAIDRVSNHDSNLGIIRYQENYEDFYAQLMERKEVVAEPLWSYKYRLLISRDSPLAKKDEIELSDIAKLTEITNGDPSVLATQISRKVERQQQGISPRGIVVYERQSQLELLSRIPQTYAWMAPAPKRILARYGLVEKTCRFVDYDCRDVLICREGYNKNEGDQLFIQKVKEEIEALRGEAD